MTVDIPKKLRFLFSPARAKVLYGGRYGLKSWGCARALLIQAATTPLRVLCARETQKSIADSVHKLLSDQIAGMGLQDKYTIEKASIRSNCGSEFIFAGLKHNIGNIKSVEGVDRCWVEEAQTVSKSSWDTLIPTIRKAGSEIWVSFNPELESDDTYRRWVINPPDYAVVVKTSYRDNKWVTEEIRQEIEHCRAVSEDDYLHIYEGHCRRMLDGAVYAAELRDMEANERETRVPYDPAKPVHTYWDLGWSDNTAIWFAQSVGMEWRILEYLEGSQRRLSDYVKDLKSKDYIYGTHYLPHDARSATLAADGKSIEGQLKAFGFQVKIVKDVGLVNGINEARTIFPLCYFDRDKCSDGLRALRHYRYERDEDKQTLRREPLHDWASHGADAFRMFAVAAKQPEREFQQQVARAVPRYGAQSWMA